MGVEMNGYIVSQGMPYPRCGYDLRGAVVEGGGLSDMGIYPGQRIQT